MVEDRIKERRRNTRKQCMGDDARWMDKEGMGSSNNSCKKEKKRKRIGFGALKGRLTIL